MSLAIIAGEGRLPEVLVNRLDAQKIPFRYCEMEGHPSSDRARKDRPIMRFRVEKLGSFIDELKGFGVTEICLVGRVVRPALDPSLIDAATMPLVPRMMAALQAGDDAALRLVLGFFEEAGIKVSGAQDFAYDLLVGTGVLSKRQPDEGHLKDAARGVEIIGVMAQADVGQACIVKGGQALAIEAMGGTDRMMRSLMVPPKGLGKKLLENESTWDDPIGVVADYLSGAGSASSEIMFVRDPAMPEGGLLVKASKPGQDRRVDMPTIGPDTILTAAMVGLEGIVIEAGGVFMIDQPRCVELADSHNLILWVME